MLTSDNDHHEDKLVRGGIEIECTAVNKWDGGCDVRPVMFEGFRHHIQVELDVLDSELANVSEQS